MISVIIPAYNEGDGIRQLHQRLAAVSLQPGIGIMNVVLIDDGEAAIKRWRSPKKLPVRTPTSRLCRYRATSAINRRSRRVLEHAKGDLIAVIDADLQDPPEELHRFFAKCREGFDIVYAIRTKRKEGVVKRLAYKIYYRLLASLASIPIPLDSGDFCVMNRRALDALNALPERSRFIRGLRSWIGFQQTGLAYERQARAAGEPKYTFRKFLQFSVAGQHRQLFRQKPFRG